MRKSHGTIAGRLTLEIYRMLRGETAAAFNRPISYPVSGVA
jgi:hypothetical protein